MNVYVYQAALYCEDCGVAIRNNLKQAAIDNDILDMPTPETDEREYDSDRYPKGPCPDGGGASTILEHCAGCGVSLDNWVSGMPECECNECSLDYESDEPDEGEQENDNAQR